MSDCKQCGERDEKIKALERDVKIWKAAACTNPELQSKFIIKDDPWSPIGVKFEPLVIE